MNKRLPTLIAVAAALTIAVPAQAHAEYRVRAIQAMRVRDARASAAWPATDHRWSALTDTAQSPLGSLSNRFGSGSALVGSALVGNGPDFTAVDPATHTLYVANGFNEDGDPDGGNTVSVIDERHCRADDVSRCKGPWPTLTVGSDPNADPSAVAIDQQTDTLYVADSNDNTVAVFNGATCNAETSAGCGQTPAMVPVGGPPVAIFDDPANHTVYIPNAIEDDLSMLDTATCNATDLAACPTTPPPTVTVAGTPTVGAVDPSTQTVYVTVCGDPDFGCASWHQRRFGVRCEHLQRDRAIGMRPARHCCPPPSPPSARRSIPPIRPCTRPAGTTRSQRLICVAAAPPTSRAARPTRPAS